MGDGTNADRLVPVQVSGLASGAQAIAAGGKHTCALTTAGAVLCWGYNVYGQLGDGTQTDHWTPVAVTGITSGIQVITAGSGDTCAVNSTGGVKCWGMNLYGQLGDGTTVNRLTPTNVVGLAGSMQAISAGNYHTCALTASGGVKCWGFNQQGQLGTCTADFVTTPVSVSTLTSGVQFISAGSASTCAVTGTEGAKCWGNNFWGQLGAGTTADRWKPQDVSGLTAEIRSVAAGGDHTCALAEAGGVTCWGYNGYGQLGDGTTTDHWTPVDVIGLTGGAQSVATGLSHTCAVTAAGGVKCWGWNEYGQLGDGTKINRATPVDVTGLASGVKAIAAGWYHTCALTEAGAVKCWGWNATGQLGNGTTTDHTTPVAVIGLASGVESIAAGESHSCARVAGGIKCWGWNLYGQLGNGTTTDYWKPVAVINLTDGVEAIAAGRYHTCALVDEGGGVQCWGTITPVNWVTAL
ncbi:MAG: biotin transporter BioY [Anaerolineales bacterium]|nr:biotin transporter BioY [Anaerolineales bacterium]